MEGPLTCPLRLIVQYVRLSVESSVYRIVVYGDGRTYQRVEIEDVDQVRRALHDTLPEFESFMLSEARDTQIVFSADTLLEDDQLRRLGVL